MIYLSSNVFSEIKRQFCLADKTYCFMATVGFVYNCFYGCFISFLFLV